MHVVHTCKYVSVLSNLPVYLERIIYVLTPFKSQFPAVNEGGAVRQAIEFNRISWYFTILNCSSALVKMELRWLFFFKVSLTHLLILLSFPFQTLLVLSSLSAIALVISLLVVLSFLIHYCCCHRGDRSEGSEEEEEDEDGSTGHGYSGKKGRGICCVTWMAVAAVTLCWWEGGNRHYISWKLTNVAF